LYWLQLYVGERIPENYFSTGASADVVEDKLE